MDGSEPSFPGQFLIGALPAVIPCDFREIMLAPGMRMAVHETLAVTELHFGDGRLAGAVLGLAVDMHLGRTVHGTLTLPIEPNAGRAEIADAAHDRLAGSYLLVIADTQGCSVFPDASASMGAVFDRRTGLAGSSAELVLGDAYDARLRPDLIAAFGASRDGWFTAGLTAHDDLERLLPNHHLELPQGMIARSRMRPMPGYVRDPRRVIAAIAEEIAVVSAAVAAEHQTAQTLTGGHETRAMLAANRQLAPHLEFVTVAVPGAERDVALARRLASLAGLSHGVLRGVCASELQAEAWSRAAGHALAGMNRDWHPSVAPLEDAVLLGGLGGEVGRGFLWPRGMTAWQAVTPELILRRLKLPAHPLLLDRTTRWLAALPAGLDAFQLLDLAYLELRMGPWVFGQGYPRSGPRDLHPLISHRQFARMWSLPPEFRRNGGLARALVADCWPELASIPVNRYGGIRDIGALTRVMIRRPDRVLGRLSRALR